MPEPKLVVFSGAGLSADSGLATFRGDDGLWAGASIDQVCNYQKWKANFEQVHAFYNGLRTQLAQVQPNPMHRLLVDWQKRYGATLITQNVDDLLERAGAEDVLHAHGRLVQMRCEACGKTWEIGYRAWDCSHERCPCSCRKGIKPDVVFFGERAPEYPRIWKLLSSLEEQDLLVVIGTDGAVIPIGKIVAELPCRAILNNLAPVPKERWTSGMVAPGAVQPCDLQTCGRGGR